MRKFNFKAIAIIIVLCTAYCAYSDENAEPKKKHPNQTTEESSRPVKKDGGRVTTQDTKKLDDNIKTALGDSKTGNETLDDFLDDTLKDHAKDVDKLTEQLDELISEAKDPEALLDALSKRYKNQKTLLEVIAAKKQSTSDLLGKSKPSPAERAELTKRVQRFADQNNTSDTNARTTLKKYYETRKAYEAAKKAYDRQRTPTTEKALRETRQKLADFTMDNAFSRTKQQAKEFQGTLSDSKKAYFRKKNGQLSADLKKATSIRQVLGKYQLLLKHAPKIKKTEDFKLTRAMVDSVTKGQVAKDSRDFWGRVTALETALKTYKTARTSAQREKARADLLAKSNNFKEYRTTLHPWVQSLKARSTKDPEAAKLAQRVESLYGLIGGKGEGTLRFGKATTVVKNRYDLNQFFSKGNMDRKKGLTLRNWNYVSAYSHLKKKSPPPTPAQRLAKKSPATPAPKQKGKTTQEIGLPVAQMTHEKLLKHREKTVQEIEKSDSKDVSREVAKLRKIHKERDQRERDVDSVPLSTLKEEQRRRKAEVHATTAGTIVPQLAGGTTLWSSILTIKSAGKKIQGIDKSGQERKKAVNLLTQSEKWRTREGKPIVHKDLLDIIYNPLFDPKANQKRINELIKKMSK